MALKLIAALLLTACSAFADQGNLDVFNFGGQNDSVSSDLIENYEAQSALNVEANISGTAILKREGYKQNAVVGVTTGPVSGSHVFLDNSGNTNQIVCNDRQCSILVNGGAPTVFLTTSVVPNYWQFVDLNGTMYGVNDKNDPPISYNGITLTNIGGGSPNGAVIELTKDRLAIAGTTANPNRVYYSQSGVYTNFVTGVNSADPWFDDFGTTGDKITGLKYDRGKLFIFKRTSITACATIDQYQTRCYPISNNIGTSDPLCIVSAPDGVYFRAQDRTYWRITDSGIELLSKKIINLVKSQTAGSNQQNVQNTQAAWQAGTQFPLLSWNTVSTVGSIFPSSGTAIDSFTAIANSTGVYVLNNRLVLGTTLFTNGGFESNSFSNWTNAGFQIRASAANCCGTYQAIIATNVWTMSSGLFQVLDGSSLAVLLSTPTSRLLINVSNMAFTPLDISTITAATLRIQITDGVNSLRSPSFSRPLGVLWLGNTRNSTVYNGNVIDCFVADFPEPIISSSGSYTSPGFDTTFTTPTFGPFSAVVSSPSSSGISLQTQSSADNITWGAPLSIGLGNIIASNSNRYVRYVSNFSVPNGGSAMSPSIISISSVTLQYATTGQFVSQCIQPPSNISAWSTLSCGKTLTGAGSLVFYTTSAATCATLPTTAPNTWQTTTANNSAPTISTNVAVYIGFRSLLGSSTDQAQVDNCTLNWTVGTAAPPQWGVYDSLKNSIYWTAAINNSATANRVLKYDLNILQWFPMSLNANALKEINNQLYFGDSTAGKWYSYGSVNNDNGAAINSYWQSKDFHGSPNMSGHGAFNDTIWQDASVVARNPGGGSLTATWTTSLGQTGNYAISLSTVSTLNYVRGNFTLPSASPAPFFNIKFGNNAANSPWEIDGLEIGYFTYPWTPINP